MDAVSYSLASKQAQRIEKFIENPDSASGIVTVPKVIASGETITIPAGRVAVLPNVQVDGTLNISGEVFIPSGATFGDLEDQIALKAPLASPSLTGTPTINGVNVSGYNGFKNYIINGDMRIAQRGVGPFTTNGYGIDQWFSYISSTASHVTRIWSNTGINHISYAEVYVGSGADTVTMEQRLEHPHRFSGKTLTLSYKLFNGNYSGFGVNYNISLCHAGGRTTLFSGISLFAGGDKIKVTFTVPYLSGYTLNASSYLEIRPVEIIQRGYSGKFGITDVQLEEGSVATPFEQRPYGLELSLCQRYYETGVARLDVYSNADSIFGYMINFKQVKRINPSLELLNINYVNANSASAAAITKEAFLAYATSLSQAQSRFAFVYTASAEL